MVCITNGSGSALKYYDYDAFGNEKNLSNDANPFRYCGEYFDKETKTYYLRARYYDPAIGRFTQQDSLLFTTRKLASGYEYVDPLSLNLYTYCYNDPVQYSDPSGHIPAALAIPVVAETLYVSILATLGLIAGAVEVGKALNEAEKVRENVYSIIESNIIKEENLSDYSVYVITNEENKVAYVGMTKSFGSRRDAHMKGDNARFPKDTHDIFIVHTGMSYEEARLLEETLIIAFVVEAGGEIALDMAMTMSIRYIDDRNILNLIHSISPAKWKKYYKEAGRIGTLMECMIF